MEPSIPNCNFCTDTNQSATNIAELTPLFQSAIAKHFWFQESELLALQICSVCSKKIMDFHLFYSTVEQLHAANDQYLKQEGNFNEEVIVKNEPLDSELISGDLTNGEQLIVGDVAFEIVDVSAKTEFVENESELPDEVKHEIAEALINKKKTVHCLNCEKSFEDKMVLELHMKMVHGDQSAVRRCAQCAQLEQALREALKQDIAEIPESSERVQCSVCNGKLKNVASLQRHLTWHWGEPCNGCRKRPNSYEPTEENQKDTSLASNKHDQTKSRKSYDCTYCEKKFWELYLLKLHINRFHHCQKCTALDQALQDLSERSESGETGRVKCSVCDAWLMNLASLQRHMDWHKSEPCEGCRFRRSRQDMVEQHVHAQNMPKTRSQPVNSQAKKPKMDDVSIKHICVYCGLYFGLHVELIDHQVKEHPNQKHRKYTAIGNRQAGDLTAKT